MGGLDGGDGAVLSGGNFYQLLGAPFLVSAHVKMVADQQQKWLVAGEVPRAKDGVAVSPWRALLYELQAAGVGPGRSGIRRLIAGANYHADLLQSGLEDFFNDDGQSSFAGAIAIDQRLQRQRSLALAGGGDDGFFQVHEQTRTGPASQIQ